jgi:hypothetical protein
MSQEVAQRCRAVSYCLYAIDRPWLSGMATQAREVVDLKPLTRIGAHRTCGACKRLATMRWRVAVLFASVGACKAGSEFGPEQKYLRGVIEP